MQQMFNHHEMKFILLGSWGDEVAFCGILIGSWPKSLGFIFFLPNNSFKCPLINR